jgi:hypothetical protein
MSNANETDRSEYFVLKSFFNGAEIRKCNNNEKLRIAGTERKDTKAKTLYVRSKLQFEVLCPKLIAYCFVKHQQNVKAISTFHLSTPVWNDVWTNLK